MTNFFSILIYISNIGGREIKRLDQLKGLLKFNPILSIILSISIFSLAGIPPLAGFFGKLLLLEHYLNYYSFFFIYGYNNLYCNKYK